MFRFNGAIGVAILMAAVVGCATSAQGLPEALDYELIAPQAFADEAAARAAWEPMYDSAPLSVATVGGRKALRCPCNFADTSLERVSWDLDVPLDLAGAMGVQFRFYCPDSSPVSTFNLYFRSGGGWYATIFAPDGSSGWSTVRITKGDMGIEGQPKGWGSIDRIRISAWAAERRNTEFYLADLGILGADAQIVLVRGEYAARQSGSEARSIEQFAKAMGQRLTDLGLAYVPMSDIDVSAKHLAGKKLLILPYNPALPPGFSETVKDFVASGGKLMSFYMLHPELGSVIGMKRGTHMKAQYDGQFSSMRTVDGALPGLPASTEQRSWNISTASPVPGRAKVAAVWCDADGKSTGEPAVIVSDTTIHMTHVMLTDDPGNKLRMLLAMVMRFAPECGQEAAESHVRRIGEAGGLGSFENLVAFVRRNAKRDEPMTWLKQADRLRTDAARLAAKDDVFGAMEKAVQSREYALRAFCAAQKSERGEHRAFWCHDAMGVDGMTWDEAVKTLADNGFTAILPNMLWGGTAYYESDVLPRSWQLAEHGDQIAECLAACKKYGVECHVWKVNFNMSSKAKPAFVKQMVNEGRVQVALDGTREDTWLCPSHPANQQLEIDSMVEVAMKYDVDGVHFDYIRYPDDTHCFCAGCRKRFEASLGRKVKNWPADARNDEALKARWNEFRRTQITTVVEGVHRRLRKDRPKVEISAAVFRNWPIHRDSVAQDWKVWCDKGYLDFVCPMDYVPQNGTFDNMVAQQVGWAGDVPVYPGIGLSCWPDRTDIVKLIQQIEITRKHKTGGFTIFNYGVTEADVVVPQCGLGVTR
ncbi:MAG: family 10 glycosylhydrolase [bacterium]|nr:family 10 glycosylhydrolase [bacterium]